MRPSLRTRYFLPLAFAFVIGACTEPEIPAEQESPPVASQGMQFFHGPFEDALAEAKRQDKKVFVDVYTTWCGPCIVMQENVFPQPEVGEFFNARFVNFKLDAEDESIDGPEIAARYDIREYPTYLVLDSDGKELDRANTGMSAEQFVTLFSQILGETESGFAAFQARYDTGERSPEFLQQYLGEAMVEMASWGATNREKLEQFKAIAGDYFTSRDFSALLNETDAVLVTTYWEKKPRGDDLVEYVFSHYDDFLAVSSEAAFSLYVLNATWYSGVVAAEKGDGSYQRYLDDLHKEPLSKAVAYDLVRDPQSTFSPDRMQERFFVIDAQVRGDWDAIAEYYGQKISARELPTDAGIYNSAATSLGASPNPAHQEQALAYAAQAYELKGDELWIVLTYARALENAGKTEEANQVISTFRHTLGDTAADQQTLKLLNRILGPPAN